MNIVFFAVPYKGHLVTNISLLKELVRCDNNITIVGDNCFFKDYISSGISYIDLPDYIKKSYDVKVNYCDGEISDYFSFLYDFETIMGRQNNINEMQEQFYFDFFEECRNYDVIIYDTYAYYCGKIVNECDTLCVEINSSLVENGDFFLKEKWKEYIHDIVYYADANALEFPTILSTQKRVYRIANNASIIKNTKRLAFCYHCPSMQFVFSDLYQYVGFNIDLLYDVPRKDFIYVSRGTMQGNYSFYVLLEIAKKLEENKFKSQISLGDSDEFFNKVSEINSKWKYTEFGKSYNQLHMLKCSDIFISHGGLTGVREAILCEIPIIVLPVNYQDYCVGLAVEKNKIGFMIRNIEELNDKLKEYIDRIRNDYLYYHNNIVSLKNELCGLWIEKGAHHICDSIVKYMREMQ